jgi:putative DNA methylase
MTKYRKKLIEVALPLEAINVASAREKSIRHGHPSTLHPWWARRPLATARAVIFSQMVDDPSEYVDELLAHPERKGKAEKVLKSRKAAWETRRLELKKARKAALPNLPDQGPEPTLEDVTAEQERDRLFAIIEDLVLWENTTNEVVLQKARDEIWRSWHRTCEDNKDHPRAAELFKPDKLPAFYDPFAGGGSLPLEAQRLGLEAYASDLNPVAVLICKAMIELPPKFAGMPPVNPEARKNEELFARQWRGAEGLAEDVRHYGRWMRDQAEKRVGHQDPEIEVTSSMALARPDLRSSVGKRLTVIAWLWARTVRCPNPACGSEMPLVRSFVVSRQPGKEVWARPAHQNGKLAFHVTSGKISIRDGTVDRNGARCVACGTPVGLEYIRSEGQAHRMSARMLAIIAAGKEGRVALSPLPAHEALAPKIDPAWIPNEQLQGKCRVSVPLYGMEKFGDLYTTRQLVLLTTFAGLVGEARAVAEQDLAGALAGGASQPYLDALTTYLGLTVSKLSVFHNVIARWRAGENKSAPAFGRQAIPMVWDYAEVNPFAGAGGDFLGVIEGTAKVIENLPNTGAGEAKQANAMRPISSPTGYVISTDPPYYDNIEYADLSDFFYLWLRRTLSGTYPKLFETLQTPKAEELVASPFRFSDRDRAQEYFEEGLAAAFKNCREVQNPYCVLTVYYAFKQSETDEDSDDSAIPAPIASTGWETFLAALLGAGFCITGTWPSRTEGGTRLVARGANALASSIVLVCRPRSEEAGSASRREFLAALKKELAPALRMLQQGSIAPVDLAQAAIGPGMAVFSRYSSVLEAGGTSMSVRTALALINQAIDEYFSEQEGDFDSDTRWALAWFDQSGFTQGEFGVADVLARAKDTSVEGMAQAGILASGRGKVRLLRPNELPANWDPADDARLTVWESVHHLIRVLESNGEAAAAGLAAKLGTQAETARELCYRLYTICDRKKRMPEALSYNGLVHSWPEIMRIAREPKSPKAGEQLSLPEQEQE